MNLRVVRKPDGRLGGVTLMGTEDVWHVSLSHDFFPGRAFDLQYNEASKKQVLLMLFNGFGHKMCFSAAREIGGR